MQDTKDSFYVALRDRLSATNPHRTVVVRGQTRPGVVVDENELPERVADEGVFHLRWSSAQMVRDDAMPLESAVCEIRYRSRGGDALNALARGREMAAMDGELDAMLQPANASKMHFDASTAVAATTRIFWAEAGPRLLTEEADGLVRVAKVTVMSFEERGDV